ncbi:MAG: hypothetical protein ACRD0U_16495, partial [Acidimicrobiales bacterium]
MVRLRGYFSAVLGHASRRRRWYVVATLLAVGLALGGGTARLLLRSEPAAAVLPFYDVTVTTPGVAPVTRTGVALDVPVLLDADRNGGKDLAVRVGLVNPLGVFDNPLDVSDILAPHVAIDRVASATNPPVRVVVSIPIGLPGAPASTFLRFGYDTGPAGSIPQNFQAVVGGVTTLFNPLQAVVDTSGGILGIDTGLPGLTDVSRSYQGPLTLVAGVTADGSTIDADLAYDPFPHAVRVIHSSDDAGQHLAYTHPLESEVDLTATVALSDAEGDTALAARVDRLPSTFAADLDLPQGEVRGAVDFEAGHSPRPPDVGLALDVQPVDGPPTTGRIDVEALPSELHVDWDLPPDGPGRALFEAPDEPVGAVEAHLLTAGPEPSPVSPVVPTEPLFVDLQSRTNSSGESEGVIAARLEGLRRVEFVRDDAGLNASYDVGDGTKAVDVNLDVDARDGGFGLLRGRTTIAPLPETATVTLRDPGADPFAEPFTLTYDAADTIDVRGNVELFRGDGERCGDLDSICAVLDLRDLPGEFEVRNRDRRAPDEEGGEHELRIEIDLPADRPGPDIDAEVTIGGEDGPLVASLDVPDAPPFLRALVVDAPVPPDPDAPAPDPEADRGERVLERFELHPCDRDFDADEPSCRAGTEAVIADVELGMQNFVDGPPGLPVLPITAPEFVSLVARPDDTGTLAFRADARLAGVREAQFVNQDGVLGLRVGSTGSDELAAALDISSRAADLAGTAVVRPLPETLDFCFQRPDAAAGDAT